MTRLTRNASWATGHGACCPALGGRLSHWQNEITALQGSWGSQSLSSSTPEHSLEPSGDTICVGGLCHLSPPYRPHQGKVTGQHRWQKPITNKSWSRNKDDLVLAPSRRRGAVLRPPVTSTKREVEMTRPPHRPLGPQTRDTYGDVGPGQPFGILQGGQEVIVGWAEEVTVSWEVEGNHTGFPRTIPTSPQQFQHRLLVENHSLPSFNHSRWSHKRAQRLQGSPVVEPHLGTKEWQRTFLLTALFF